MPTRSQGPFRGGLVRVAYCVAEKTSPRSLSDRRIEPAMTPDPSLFDGLAVSRKALRPLGFRYAPSVGAVEAADPPKPALSSVPSLGPNEAVDAAINVKSPCLWSRQLSAVAACRGRVLQQVNGRVRRHRFLKST